MPCAKLLSIGEIFADPQYAARENLVQVNDPRLGPLTIPGSLPRMSKTPPTLNRTGHDANSQVFEELLGLPARAVAELKARGVI